MEREYNDNKKHDKERMQGDYLLYEWLGEACTKVCWRAQDLVVRQYRHMLRYLPDSPWNKGKSQDEIPILQSSGSQFTRHIRDSTGGTRRRRARWS